LKEQIQISVKNLSDRYRYVQLILRFDESFRQRCGRCRLESIQNENLSCLVRQLLFHRISSVKSKQCRRIFRGLRFVEGVRLQRKRRKEEQAIAYFCVLGQSCKPHAELSEYFTTACPVDDLMDNVSFRPLLIRSFLLSAT